MRTTTTTALFLVAAVAALLGLPEAETEPIGMAGAGVAGKPGYCLVPCDLVPSDTPTLPSPTDAPETVPRETEAPQTNAPKTEAPPKTEARTTTTPKHEEQASLALDNSNADLKVWTFDGHGSIKRVAAAQTAGVYAVASDNWDIEIRDINRKLLHRLDKKRITDVLDEIGWDHEPQLCAMTFSSSGRFLYIAVCDDHDSGDDVILAYNTNIHIKKLSFMEKLSLGKQRPLGMTFFYGALFVGSQKGLYRLDARRNVVYTGEKDYEPQFFSIGKPVTGIAVDMFEHNLYAVAEDGLYGMKHNKTSSIERLYKDSHLRRVSMGLTYGSTETSGLFLLRDDGKSELLYIDLKDLRSENYEPKTYAKSTTSDILDMSATAEGGMMLATTDEVVMMTDSRDERMGFVEWMRDELQAYITAYKSLVQTDGSIAGTNTYSPEGFIARKIESANHDDVSHDLLSENSGWALLAFLTADNAMPDPDIECIAEKLIERHVGMHSDGLCHTKSVDGLRQKYFHSDGTDDLDNADIAVYSIMKLLPAVYKAADMYPNNKVIQRAKEFIRQPFKRGSDILHGEQKITWFADDFGPRSEDNGVECEVWLFAELAAAQDPMATENYATYVHERESLSHENWLKGEPVIRKHSAFITFGGTAIQAQHAYDEDWAKMNHNFYAANIASCDDGGSPYLTTFSAGGNSFNPNGKFYTSDNFDDHKGDIIHFFGVIGFGQLGLMAPMVGGYRAYRDGRRMKMRGLNGSVIEMLTRWSFTHGSFDLNAIGVADSWFGAVGLAEAIKPGSTDLLREYYYRPKLKVTENAEGGHRLLYSLIAARKVIAIDGDKEISYGFQLAPFDIPFGGRHEDYRVVDPEGDFIELNDIVSPADGLPSRFINPDFESKLEGWHQSGNYKFDAVKAKGQSIVGYSAEIEHPQGSKGGEGYLSQSLLLRVDLDNTQYCVRGNGRYFVKGKGKAYMRVRWTKKNDLKDKVLKEETSNVMDSDNDLVEFEVYTLKPKGAEYMHIQYVVEAEATVRQRFFFDNTSVVRRGAKFELENGDMEDGEKNWDLKQSTKIKSIPEAATNGDHVLYFHRETGENYLRGIYTHDISKDPLGIRYVYRYDADLLNSTNSKFKLEIEMFDKHDKEVGKHEGLSFVPNGFKGERSFSARKRPGEATHKITFQMRHLGEIESSDYAYIDNFRVEKQRLFIEDECTGSITGC